MGRRSGRGGWSRLSRQKGFQVREGNHAKPARTDSTLRNLRLDSARRTVTRAPFVPTGCNFHTVDPSGDHDRHADGRSARACQTFLFSQVGGKGVWTSTIRSPPARLRLSPFVFPAHADRQPRKDLGRVARMRRSGGRKWFPLFSSSPPHKDRFPVTDRRDGPTDHLPRI